MIYLSIVRVFYTCIIFVVILQAKVDNLKATVESIAQKLNEISEIHVDAEGTTSVTGYESSCCFVEVS